MIPRLQLFEFEDLPWFPQRWRNLLTEALRFGIQREHIYHAVVPLIMRRLEHTHCHEIIDLGSGAAGPWVSLYDLFIQAGYPITVTLTDKYPHVQALANVSTGAAEHIHFCTDSIDARCVPPSLQGMRTMFTAFHHFPPEEARLILQNAVQQKVAIGIFEMTQRSITALLLTPILVIFTTLFNTPRIKPLTLERLLWTYLVPIVPFVNTWDGIVSNLRTYTPHELFMLLHTIEHHSYDWEIGQIPITGLPTSITYLIGYPKKESL